jgi:hypothetical protein
MSRRSFRRDHLRWRFGGAEGICQRRRADARVVRRDPSDATPTVGRVGFWGSLAVEIVGGVVTAGLLAGLVAYLNADNQIDAHDREVRALDEDMRRFVRDRDRVLWIELTTVTDEMAGRGIVNSSIHLGELADRKRQALHEYRDELIRKRRLYREVCERERWATRLLRRRRGALPRFELSNESKLTVASWRRDATGSDHETSPVDDPTSAEREPDLQRFEEEGDHCS